MHRLVVAGRDAARAVDAEDLRRRVAGKENILLLDVRSRAECLEIPSDPSLNIWIGDLPQKLDSLPRDRKIITLCSSGHCAIIAASLLKQARFDNVEVYLGADKTYKTPLITGKPVRRAA